MEHQKKSIHKCHCYAAILANQINEFVNPYALQYPVFSCQDGCDICPYVLKKKAIEKLTTNEKAALLDLYHAYSITPKNIAGEDLTDEQRIGLICEFLDENRTLFHREEERIIYTEAFRRLQYKTQVMINSASDDQRTRLLHSLEVQKISRKIAVALKANYELAETIAIAHDIGHAPFGHAGEYAIRDYLEKKMAGSFSHALQSVKVIDYLCSHRTLKTYGGKGLGISDYVLEGVLKHDSDSFMGNIASSAYRLQYNCPELYKPVGISDDFYKDETVYIGSIESQIVCWADKIAYMSHDWEEFVAVGLLEIMLSRINSITIHLHGFISNQQNTCYNYIADTEKRNLIELNNALERLKKTFYIKSYLDTYDSENDSFVNALKKLINRIEYICKQQKCKPENYVFFSSEQYQILKSFFKAAWAWIEITKQKPKKIGGKMDIIFIIHKYLCDTTSHRTVPALIDALISGSKEKLMGTDFILSRRDQIKKCNQEWISKQKSISKSANHNNAKDRLRSSFAVSFSKKVSEPVKYINEFIYEQYIYSTRIKFMTSKANKIIEGLFDFYYKNPEMLPLKYRKIIELEYGLPKKNRDTKILLEDYYFTRIKMAIERDKKRKR